MNCSLSGPRGVVVVMRCISTPTPRTSSLGKQGGNITTAENAAWAARGVARLATAWVRTRDRTGRECRRWLGRLQPVSGKHGAYRATKQRAAFAHVLCLELKYGSSTRTYTTQQYNHVHITAGTAFLLWAIVRSEIRISLLQ